MPRITPPTVPGAAMSPASYGYAYGMPGASAPVAVPTSNLGAPMAGQMTQVAPVPVGAPSRLTWSQRLQIFIFGADAPWAWMNPQQPLQPVAQPPEFQAVGRMWDYPVGYNTRVPPRSGNPISFTELKRLSVEYDVLRIMIERVKDKVISQVWSIGMKDEKAKRDDTRCDEITAFLEYPDKVHPWDDWARMLMDQVLVYDAPAVWLRPTRGGDLYSLEIIDGSTIAPKIMADGRLPPPEFGPAYQQVLKGIPAVDYIQPIPRGVTPSLNALDPSTGMPLPELYYRPRNVRVDSVYGYGPVEQIIRTVEIGIQQEKWLRDYFTSGSTPDLLIKTPENWNAAQIQQMQDFWDSMLVGNLVNRRGARFIPGGTGMDVVDTKEKALMDAAVQEWLVRVMCFALGLNPMPFVKMMNKGQEETHHSEAAEEGLKPWLEWFANFINTLIAIKWGYRDVVFRWKETDDTDPQVQATIDKMLVEAKIYHPDELRAKRGDAPMPDEMRLQMDMANYVPSGTVLPPEQQAEADERAEKQAEAQAGRDEAMLAAAGKEKATPKTEKGDVFVDIGKVVVERALEKVE